MVLRCAIQVLVVGSTALIQLGCAIFVGIDAIWLRRDAARTRWLVLVPFVVYSFFALATRAYTPSATWRGIVHTLFFAYAVAVPGVAFVVARVMCIDGDPTLALLRQSDIEAYAQRCLFVSGAYVTTGLVRVGYACAHARLLAEDQELALLEASIASATPRHAAVTSAARRRRKADVAASEEPDGLEMVPL